MPEDSDTYRVTGSESILYVKRTHAESQIHNRSQSHKVASQIAFDFQIYKLICL